MFGQDHPGFEGRRHEGKERMVARSPPKDERQAFSKTHERSQLLRETVRKVDRAMARLQEIQCTVTGSKVHLGVNLSPRSTRGYMRMSLRCKQESLRTQPSAKETASDSNGSGDNKYDQMANPAQLDSNISPGHWRRWSLPAAIVQQAVGEILEASNFAKEVANIVSNSMGNNLVQDPKTPQSVCNGTNLFKEITKTDTKNDCKVGSVSGKDVRCNAQGYRKLKHRHYALSNAELRNIKATQSSLATPPGKRLSLIGHLQEEGFDGKRFYDNMGRLNLGNEEKKPVKKKSQKVVYKFRMVTPEKKVKALCYEGAASSLEFRRKAEKQQVRARARAELSQASSKVQCQMSFRASNHTNECGKSARALASALVPCCTSPARSIGTSPARSIEKQIGATPKLLVKVDQIKPAQKPRITHHKSNKAIMFPNPTFVPSPSDCQNSSARCCRRTRCTACSAATSMERRKSLPSLKGFSTPKFRRSSPLCKENGSVPQKIDTLKPPFNLNDPKIKKLSPPSKVMIRTPVRTVRQSPRVKTSAASNPSRNTPCSSTSQKSSKFHRFSSPLVKESLKDVTPSKFPKISSPFRNKTPKHALSPKYTKFFSPFKNKSPKRVSPSKFPRFSSPFKSKCSKHVASARQPVCFRRRSFCSESSPVTYNIPLLPKQQVASTIQSLPSLISKLPSRRRSYSMTPNVHYDMEKKAEPYPREKDVPDKIMQIKGAGSGRDLPLPPGWGATMPFASTKDSSIKSSNLRAANSPLDEMPYQSSVLECGRSISCPKQRPLKAIDNIANSNSIGNRFDTAGAMDTQFSTKRKDQQLEGKENQPVSEKEGHDAMLKKSNRFLRRSWSFGHENATLLKKENLNNSSGGLPFLKYVRGCMNKQRAA